MEFLVELLIELFGEIIITLIGEGIGAFVLAVDSDSKLKRTLKKIFTYSILTFTILLIIMSLVYSKTFLTIIATSYMLSILIILLFKRLNKDNYNNKGVDLFLNILRRIVRYGYPIVLIIFSSIYLTNKSAITWIIVLSALDLVLWLSIDIFKLWKKSKYHLKNIDSEEDEIL